MIVRYLVNGVPCSLLLPSAFVETARAEFLAELAANDYWRQRQEMPAGPSLVHLVDVDGTDLGIFEVTSELKSVFSATALSTAHNQPRRK